MIRLRLLWLPALLLWGYAHRQANAQADDPHLAQAVELLRQQQFAAALPELEQAQRDHPNIAEIENLLGITETQLGDLSQANTHYRKAVALNPKLAGPHKNLGFNELKEKVYSNAERELKTALALDPHDPFTHYYLGNLYLATSHDDLAVEQLEPARTLLANDPENELLMAKACLNTGRNADATALIQTLSDHSQLSTADNYDLALLLTSRKLYGEAALRFEYALTQQPESWVVKSDLGIAYLNAGHARKAISLLQPLAAEHPENALTLSVLGLAYEASDQLPQALEAYKAAVRADAQNPDRYLDYTRLLMEMDRNDEAMKIVEKAIPTTQDAYALDLRLGVLRTKQGRFDEARVALNQAITLHPEIIVAYVAVAQSYMQQGSDDKASETLLKARATLPPDSALEYYVGLVSLRLGQYSVAEAALKSSARLRPDVVEPHYQLGKLYLETGRLPRAQAEFERVIAANPGNSNAHYQLSKIYARLGNTEKAAAMAEEAKRLMQNQREATLRAQQQRVSEFQALSANPVGGR